MKELETGVEKLTVTSRCTYMCTVVGPPEPRQRAQSLLRSKRFKSDADEPIGGQPVKS
jgi:hypothetical protein